MALLHSSGGRLKQWKRTHTSFTTTSPLQPHLQPRPQPQPCHWRWTIPCSWFKSTPCPLIDTMGLLSFLFDCIILPLLHHFHWHTNISHLSHHKELPPSLLPLIATTPLLCLPEEQNIQDLFILVASFFSSHSSHLSFHCEM